MLITDENKPVDEPLPPAAPLGFKVFQIGFNRCATTALHMFMRQNGIKSVHHDSGQLARTMKQNFETGRPLLEGYEAFEFFSDMESVTLEAGELLAYRDFFKELNRQYPGSKFIFNYRNKADWIQSRLRHNPPSTGSLLDRYKAILETDEQGVIACWESLWDSHTKKVRSYFRWRPRKILYFDIDRHTGRHLVKFLGVDGLNPGKYRQYNSNKPGAS